MTPQPVTVFRGREPLFKKVGLANSFGLRLRGLMFYPAMPGIDGLMLSPANSVHTFWMRFPLDLIFLDCNGKVILTYSNITPNRIYPAVKGADYVLETTAGTVAKHDIQKQDSLWW